MALAQKMKGNSMMWKKSMAGTALVIAGFLALPVALQAEDAPAQSDEIVLKNGSRIVGTVTDARDGVVMFETSFAGTLSIKVEEIASVQTNSPVVMLLDDDIVVRDQPLRVEQEQLVVNTGGATQSYSLEQLKVINPEPWELGQGYRWTGLASLALTMQRGNTDTDELDYRLESIWRSTRDRYTIKASGEQDESNNVKNADNWRVLGKYDYFLEGPYYWGVNAGAESDEFADLDLRYYIGPYLGRDFFTDPAFTLSGEVGLSYVDENFNIAEDDDYIASTWTIDMSSNYLGGDSRLYFNQNGIWNLDSTSDVIINTTFGLAFPLLWNFEAAAEVLLEYDSGAVENVDDLDETYRFRVGYTW
tara:strand:- start:386 stop:1468 length:1083 start_codon:yes stop_codon:yes gene_type:complete